MKEYAKQFYQGRAWKQCRLSFIKKRQQIDGGMCQQCQEELGYIVHHKINLTPSNINNVEISLNHHNLEYLCKKCHDKEHGFGCGLTATVQFDEDGNVMPPIVL